MQGYVQVYTGDGKGKTTAALGLALRAAGAGLRVYFGQFVKNADYSEIKALERLSDCITVRQFGRGCFLLTEPAQEDREAARQALDGISVALASGDYDLVVADEANVAVALGLIEAADLVALIDQRPPQVELVLTGRGAPDAVLARADLITEMRCVRHYYDQDVLARKGIES
ncbi:MAG: cob(I)yrinic acid a,c-diamide adenosyltransferase [Desulfobulbus sp.]|jgi:cob(I)alamin adenosyltransferase|nr:cob(I)yrinic acid a,c-diamide adenosyltransferase [Desulfobulbus sp.]